MTVDQKLLYQIKVDAQKAIDQLRKFSKELGNIAGAQKRLGTVTTKTGTQVQKTSNTVKKAGDSYKQFGRDVNKTTNDLTKNLRQMYVQAMALYSAFRGLQATVGQGLDFNMMIEQNTVAFEVMTKSAETAVNTIDELRKLQETTPIGLKEGAEGVKQMLAYGFAVEDAIGQMTMLQTVGSAVGASLQDMVYVYGTLRAQGRAYNRDLMQFAMRGVPIFEYLAKTMDVSVDQIKDLTAAGKVGFAEVEQAMIAMTSEGGIFEGMLQRMMDTTAGVFTRVARQYETAMGDIMKATDASVNAIGVTLLNFIQGLESQDAIGQDIANVFNNLHEILKTILPLAESVFGFLAEMGSVLTGPLTAVVGVLGSIAKVLADLGTFLAGPLGGMLIFFLSGKMVSGLIGLLGKAVASLTMFSMSTAGAGTAMGGLASATASFGTAVSTALGPIGIMAGAIAAIATAGSAVERARLDELIINMSEAAKSTAENLRLAGEELDAFARFASGNQMDLLTFFKDDVGFTQGSTMQFVLKDFEQLLTFTKDYFEISEKAALNLIRGNELMNNLHGERINQMLEEIRLQEEQQRIQEATERSLENTRNMRLQEFNTTGLGAGPSAIGVSFEDVTGRDPLANALGALPQVSSDFNAQTVFDTYMAPIRDKLSALNSMTANLLSVGVSTEKVEETRATYLKDIVKQLEGDLGALQESELAGAEGWPTLQKLLMGSIAEFTTAIDGATGPAEKISWTLREWQAKVTGSKLDDNLLAFDKEMYKLTEEFGENSEAAMLATEYYSRLASSIEITEQAQKDYNIAMSQATGTTEKARAEYNLAMSEINAQIIREGDASGALARAKRDLTDSYNEELLERIKARSIEKANAEAEAEYYNAMVFASSTMSKVDDLQAQMMLDLAQYNIRLKENGTSMSALEQAVADATEQYNNARRNDMAREDTVEGYRKAVEDAQTALNKVILAENEIVAKYEQLITEARFDDYAQSINKEVDTLLMLAEANGDQYEVKWLAIARELALAEKQHELGMITDDEIEATRLLTEAKMNAIDQYTVPAMQFSSDLEEASMTLQEMFSGTPDIGGDMMAGLGNALSPEIMSTIADPVTMVIMKLLEMVMAVEEVRQVLMPLSTIFEGINRLLQPLMSVVFRPLAQALEELGFIIGQTLMPIFAALSPILNIVTFALKLLSTVLAPLAIVFQAIYNVLAMVANAIIWVLNGFVDAVNAFFGLLNDLFGWAGVNIAMLKNLDYLPTAEELIKMTDSTETASDALDDFADKLKNTIDYVQDQLKEMVDSQVKSAQDLYEVGAISATQYEATVDPLLSMLDQVTRPAMLDIGDISGYSIEQLVSLLDWLRQQESMLETAQDSDGAITYTPPTSVPRYSTATGPSMSTATAPTYNVTVNVEGNVTTERELSYAVAEHLQSGRRTGASVF